MNNWDTYKPSAEDAQEISDGMRQLVAGSYHGIINDVGEEKSKDGDIMLVVETITLNGTMKDCAGIKHAFFFTQNEWAFKELLRLLLAVELVTIQQINDAATSNAPVRINHLLRQMKNKQLCFSLKKNKKDFLRPTFYNVNSPEAEDIPKDWTAASTVQAKADADEEEKF